MTTLYTVIDYNCEAIDRHLTAAAAAHTILTADGRQYEIREGDDGDGITADHRFYELWTRQEISGERWGKTVVLAFARTAAEAEAEIFQAVIDAHWPRHPEAMTDADYDAMQAEIAKDAAEAARD